MALVEEKINVAYESTAQEILDAVNSMGTKLSVGVTANVIKSIQHCKYSLEGVTTKSYAISTVDPNKCVVIFERLYDANTTGSAKADYTLDADSVTFDCGNFRSSFTIGLWIIEFY